jgi:hypothetical protein
MTEINHSERDHALLSASSAHRWLTCPPSAVAVEAYPNPDTEFTREGTLAHEVAEIIARQRLEGTGELTDHEKDITHEMIDCANSYADYILEQLKSPDAVVLLEQRVDFSPWVPEGFGTCDCIIIQGDTLTIIDYKYGQGVAVSATDNPQMKLYALGALNDYGFACDVTKVEMHIFQPRLDNVSDDSLTTDELLTWAEKTVKPTAEKAFKGKGNYNAGEHCRFCQHAGRCRKLKTVCTEYVETHDLRVGVPVLADFEIAEALRMEPLITLWLRKVKEQAFNTLMDGGTVPGYKLVEGKQGNRKWTNEIDVAKKLEEAGYSREDITETKLLSPSNMDKALGKKRAAELLEGFIERAPGQPTVVPETDKRPPYNRADDFDTLD